MKIKSSKSYVDTERQRYIAVINVIKMLNMMHTTNGRSVSDIAKSLRCSTKTVYRMLTALQEHQFPVWNESVYNEYSGRTLNHWKSGVRIIYDSEESRIRRRG